MENNPQEQALVQGTERRIEDTLKGNNKKEYESFRRAPCCGQGMIGEIIYLIVISGINFVFTIVALATLIKKNKYFLVLYTFYCPLDNILDDYGISNSVYEGSIVSTKTSSFTIFWCNIGKYEDGVLISYLIFIILFLCFEIVSLLIHKKVIKLSIEREGILYYILICANSLFLVIFYIYFPLLFYLFVYSIIVLSTNPTTPNSNSVDEMEKNIYIKNWEENIALPIVNSIFAFLIFIFDTILIRIKKPIILYLSMRHDNDNDNINLNNEKAKKKTLRINDNNYEIEIQANQVTYLERVGQSDKIYKFKKIRFTNLTNDFIYLFLNNKAIEDQLSITDWEFPIFNEIFLKLAKIASLIYGILFVSIPLFKLHLNKEYSYILTANTYSNEMIGIYDYGGKKPTFYSVYSSYGSFELGTTNSRFALYIIALFFILLSMGKRAIYGGYTRPIIVLICFIVSAIFVLENIIYVILSFLMILFSVFSVVCFYSMNEIVRGQDDLIPTKIFIQMVLNVFIFSICIRILIDSIQLTSILNKLRKEFGHLNDGTEPEEQEKIQKIQYQGLDNREHILNELSIKGIPKYIFYSLYGDINDVQIIPIQRDNTNNNNLNNVIQIDNTNAKQSQHIQIEQNRLDNTNIEENELATLRNENRNLREENRRLKDELSNLQRNLGNIYNSIHN